MCPTAHKFRHPLLQYLMSQQLSKREQKKLQRAIQLIEASQPHDKPRKKRKLSPPRINPSAKAEENEQLHETKSNYQLTPLSQKAKYAEDSIQNEQKLQKPQGGLNSAYPLQGADLSTYLIGYQYRQTEKDLEKEFADQSHLEEAGEAVIMHPYSSTDLSRRVGKAISGFLKANRQIFSKEHREFSQFLLRFAGGTELKN